MLEFRHITSMKKNTTRVMSFVGGASLAAAALFTIAASPNGSTPEKRFAVTCNESHAVILDTRTGQAWTQELVPNNPKTSPSFYAPKASVSK